MNKDHAFKAIAELCSVHKVNLQFNQDLENILREWELHMAGILHRHIDHACPGCLKPIGNLPLVDIVYRFDTCTCSHADYPHLAERLIHRRCLQLIHMDGEVGDVVDDEASGN